MKLLYVTARFPFGPGEAFFIPEVEALLRHGQDLRIVPMWPKGAVLHQDARKFLPRTIAPGLASPRVLAAALAEGLARPRRTLGWLGRILLAPGGQNRLKNLGAFPKALWLARLARREAIDHLHAHWSGPSSTMAMIASDLSGVPWSFTAHSTDIYQNNLLGEKLRTASFSRFIAERGLARLKKLGLEGAAANACIVHMGVPLPPSPDPEPPATGVILCAANMVPDKGHAVLIAAAGALRDRGLPFELWLAGHGPLEPALRRQVEASGLSAHVRFLGQLSHAALLALYQERRVAAFALASIEIGDEFEGIPVSLIEAMSHGVPVVSTTSGGIPELLGGGAGLIAPWGDVGALAEALERLLVDAALRRGLAAAGRRRIEEAFAIEGIAAALAARFAGGQEAERPAA